jgi:cathepsin A (carboxypeptidase C)
MKTFIASTLTAATLANSNKDDTTGIFGDADQWKSGLITIEKGTIGTDDMFYWAFESRANPETDPLVMWLTGGPGCASEVALFYENGPYQFPADLSKTLPLTQNPESWNNKANLLFVDQPIGTGFSHSEIGHDVTNEEKVGSDMAIFLRGYLEENPEYKGRDFFITGESYAGHYIPAIAYYLINTATDVELNLKGIAIGNGLTDPFAQYPAYATFSYENDLISKEWDKVMTVGMKAC